MTIDYATCGNQHMLWTLRRCIFYLKELLKKTWCGRGARALKIGVGGEGKVIERKKDIQQ